MKILTGIIILQFAAILLLYGKLASIEQFLSHPAPAGPVSPFTSNVSQSRQAPVGFGEPQDEDRLRQIIREELAAQPGLPIRSEAPGDSVIAAGPRNPDEIEQQRKQVFQQLEYFTSFGRISEMEMQKLQSDIAKLDAAGRSEAMKELTRALNSGRLEGRL